MAERNFGANFREDAVRPTEGPASRSRRQPRFCVSMEGTLGNWVNADRRHYGDGNGALSEDERAELAPVTRGSTPS